MMDNLIPVVNKLHEVLEAIDPEGVHGQNNPVIDLPCIVVVGSQSSGKSSVLESLVQRDFLPRGRDIVTRRPLILQLVHNSGIANDLADSTSNLSLGSTGSCTNSSPPSPFRDCRHKSPSDESASSREGTLNMATPVVQTTHDGLDSSMTASLSSSSSPRSLVGEEWGEFSHLPNRRFFDFFQIRREIEQETMRVAGLRQGISREPILLRIYSPHVLNLTLIDLPGITKIPVGEQPVDIESVVRSLVLEYISRPNAIILAVTPANSDLANSDALKLAREVDPHGERTLGVLTKLDLMDAGTHAADILANRASCRLRLGFVGVVCRSQQDINVNKPISQALDQERDFFRNHINYRAISHRCGSNFLAKELNKVLLKAIRDELPSLRTRINALILDTQNELFNLGDTSCAGVPTGGALLLRLLTLYVSDFHEAIQGSYGSLTSRKSASVHGGELISSTSTAPPLTANSNQFGLSGGAQINRIFNHIYSEAINRIDGSSGLSLMDVRHAIQSASGPRPSLFVPEASFEVLARRQIGKLSDPAHRCVDLVFEELNRLLERVDRSEFRRFPNLAARIVEVATDLLRERLDPTVHMIEALIDIELAYINTNHPDFCRSSGAPLGVLAGLVDQRRRQSSVEQINTTTSAKKNATTGNKSSVMDGVLNSEDVNESNGSGGGFLSYLFKAPSSARGGPDGSSATSPTMSSIARGMEKETGLEFLSEKEQVETQLIMTLLHSYVNIVKRNVLDNVPKAIMHLLVNHVVEHLSTRLVTELYREELFGELLVEDEAVVKQRKRCRTALEAYKQAAGILADLSYHQK